MNELVEKVLSLDLDAAMATFAAVITDDDPLLQRFLQGYTKLFKGFKEFQDEVRQSGASENAVTLAKRLVSRAGFPKPTHMALLIAESESPGLIRQLAARSRNAARKSGRVPSVGAPPRTGEFILCLLTRPDRQVDRLGDFEEKYRTLWLPRFGQHQANMVYIVNAVCCAGTAIRIATIAKVIDYIRSLF